MLACMIGITIMALAVLRIACLFACRKPPSQPSDNYHGPQENEDLLAENNNNDVPRNERVEPYMEQRLDNNNNR